MTATKRLFSGQNVACVRGGRLLFQKLSFSLNPGEVAHLSGPNGAGKTSLLRIMCGALPVAEGKILWEGKNFLENGNAGHAARFSFLPSDDKSLKPLETAFENLMFWTAFYDIAGAEGVCVSALKKMDILHLRDMPVRYLSAGQRRRLSLARVFLKEAPLWLLDEPLNGLDITSYDLFMEVLNMHCAKGGMAAVASHYAIEPPSKGSLHRIDVGVR
jgi:heme exporter protein A